MVRTKNLHGARLDVYLEPEAGDDPGGRATVYDIEPDRKDSQEDIRALPRRVRFYHGRIAARSLNPGTDYEEKAIHGLISQTIPSWSPVPLPARLLRSHRAPLHTGSSGRGG